jgi:glutaminyl-peptide cyclotransferase
MAPITAFGDPAMPGFDTGADVTPRTGIENRVNRLRSLTTALTLSVVMGSCSSCREPAAAEIPVSTYTIVNSFPHDTAAFTQGLVFADRILYESTGLNGQSSVRAVRIETGTVIRRHDLAYRYFGEGLALANRKLYQLTWNSHIGFIYDPRTLETIGTFTYTGQGWGLTFDGTHLVMSDGTPSLRFIDPATFEEKRTLIVHDQTGLVNDLNELEYVDGEIWANVWRTDRIARINRETGSVTGWIDLTGLLPDEERTGVEDVLNGIAYDSVNKRLFVTGKNWPRVYEIRVYGPD